MAHISPESEVEIDPSRRVGEDDEPGAKEQEMKLRKSANLDLSKVSSPRLTDDARHSYGNAFTAPEPVSSLLDKVDDESVIQEEDDPSGKRENYDGEDLSDLEDNPEFVDYLK